KRLFPRLAQAAPHPPATPVPPPPAASPRRACPPQLFAGITMVGGAAGLAGTGWSAGEAFDVGAAAAQFFFEAFEAAVEVVDAVDGGFALSGETGDDERDRGAQIGGHHLRALEQGDAGDGCDLAVDVDVGTETSELGDVHEPVFEDGFADLRDTVCHCHQG